MDELVRLVDCGRIGVADLLPHMAKRVAALRMKRRPDVTVWET